MKTFIWICIVLSIINIIIAAIDKNAIGICGWAVALIWQVGVLYTDEDS